MTGIGIVAIIVGIAVTFPAAHWLDIYIACALGILSYFVTRYIGWAIYERRRLHRERDQLVKKVMRDAGAQNSN
jgi:membrane protein implicated in regulation of membrane protease activity